MRLRSLRSDGSRKEPVPYPPSERMSSPYPCQALLAVSVILYVNLERVGLHRRTVLMASRAKHPPGRRLEYEGAQARIQLAGEGLLEGVSSIPEGAIRIGPRPRMLNLRPTQVWAGTRAGDSIVTAHVV